MYIQYTCVCVHADMMYQTNTFIYSCPHSLWV